MHAPRLLGDDGHYVLVVEGDRDGLDVTFASKKDAPWAGAPKGFSSAWRLEVLDAAGAALAAVPLDVRPFATHAGAKGKPAVVRGCVVVDMQTAQEFAQPSLGDVFVAAPAPRDDAPLADVPL